jgi:chromosome segregation protein
MLKQIEIYGFKSFAEKTILFFDEQITGIVGPNGSGKSNIVDAIKWCLGEQSLKEIRSKNPTDVIFAGSQSKPPLNFCEVTLVFDNSKGIFPVDYNEVAITRKIYRSGETEYFINRTPCRLKDIKDLILDTGLASDGYSIIPQGKVEFVVSAKPEERRLLFEEAAGIAKYKVKREETLRKLERVKLDMARVEDILAYLKEQMSSLESAVKKAKNYQKYQQELQMLECANVVIQVNSIENQLKEIEQNYLSLAQQYSELSNQISQEESFVSQLKVEIVEIEKEFLILKDENASIEKKISLSSQKIETIKQQIQNIQNNIVKLYQEIEELKNKNLQYNDELNILCKNEQEILEKLNSYHQQNVLHQEEYELYRTQISELQKSVVEKNKTISEIEYQKVKIRNETLTLTRDLQRYNLETGSLTKELQTNKNSIVMSKDELQRIEQQIIELEEKRNKYKNKIENLKQQIEEIEKQLQQKQISYDNINREFYQTTSKLESISANASVCSYNVQRFFSLLKEKGLENKCSPLSSIIKIDPQYYSLVSSYLGNKLFWIVVDNELDAKEIINVLTENNLGFATFIIKTNLDSIEFHGQIDESLLKIIEFDPVWEKVVKFVFSDTTFQDDVLKTKVLYHGGKVNDASQKEDIFVLQQKVNQLTNELKTLSDEIQTLSYQLNDYTTQKMSLEKELITVETQLGQLYSMKKEKEENVLSLEELVNVLESNLLQYDKEKEKIQQQINELNENLKSLDEQEKKLREEIEQSMNKITELQSNKVFEEYVKVNSEYVRLQQQHENLIKDIESKKEMILFIEQKINSLNIEIEEHNKTKQQLEKELTDEENTLSLLLKEREESAKKLSETVNKMEEKKVLLTEKENQIKNLIQQKEELQQQLNKIELEKNTLVNNKTGYINFLQEKYSLSFEEAVNMYGNIQEVDPQAIEKLKKRLESMSAINFAAPEEYAQLEEKYDHLVTQQQDLIKAQQDLLQVISNINQQISENFKQTFLAVRENFIKLCDILFEGGRADLILTNEDNVLESGIEIIVQPRGKKLQNINLLSGGEKSLVAFALLFAFFMVKPSPLCILDEADAQLDETNVVRFMKLLKEFSTQTKFIVITHNTRTMEFINTLYGVTMEELGVSKVMSLKLREAEVMV